MSPEQARAKELDARTDLSSTRPWRKTGTCVTSTLLKLAQTYSGLDETRKAAAVPPAF